MRKSGFMTPAKVTENLLRDKPIGYVLINDADDTMKRFLDITLGGKEIDKKVDWTFNYTPNMGDDPMNYGHVERRENGITKTYRAGCLALPDSRDMVCELFVDEDTIPDLTLELHVDLTIVSIREFTNGQDVFTYYVKSVEVEVRK